MRGFGPRAPDAKSAVAVWTLRITIRRLRNGVGDQGGDVIRRGQAGMLNAFRAVLAGVLRGGIAAWCVAIRAARASWANTRWPSWPVECSATHCRRHLSLTLAERHDGDHASRHYRIVNRGEEAEAEHERRDDERNRR